MSKQLFPVIIVCCFVFFGCDNPSNSSQYEQTQSTTSQSNDFLTYNDSDNPNEPSESSQTDTTTPGKTCHNSPCPPGHDCINGICVSGDNSQAATDENTANSPSCTSDTCKTDTVCVNGVACLKEVYFKAPCETQCKTGDICYLGECLPESSCQIFPCTTGTQCVDHVCVKVTEDSLSCLPDSVEVNGTCLKVELFDTPCKFNCDMNELCYQGECVPRSSCEIIPCKDNTICRDHICQ